jgi:hypothetical protein
MKAAISLSLATVMLGVDAGACTVCDSGTGVAVRAGIAQDFCLAANFCGLAATRSTETAKPPQA